MSGPVAIATAAAKRILAIGTFRKLALDSARARHRRLILLYHRVGPAGPAPHEIVPTVPVSVFREQVQILHDLGRIVSLADIVADDGDGPMEQPEFAISFDDDYRCHVEHVLPVLQEFDTTATFFLSGRALADLGPYWWERLEAEIRRHGLDSAGRRLGIQADSPAALAAACEGTPIVGQLEELDPAGTIAPLTADEIKRLAAAGMTIGFHTLHHPRLTDLGVADVDRHLTEGRDALERLIGQKLDLFAYPHGRATEAIARRAGSAGYGAAFITSGRPAHPGVDRHLISRWEPSIDRHQRFQPEVVMRLLMPTVVRRR